MYKTVHMDRIAAARGAIIVSFRFDPVELRRCCTLRRRLAVTIIVQGCLVVNLQSLAAIAWSRHSTHFNAR